MRFHVGVFGLILRKTPRSMPVSDDRAEEGFHLVIMLAQHREHFRSRLVVRAL